MSLLERLFLFYGTRFPAHPRKWWLHSRLRKCMGVHPNSEYEVVRDGLKWSLNPADYADEALFWLGTKDTWDIKHLKNMVKPADVILDIGANFGYYGLTLARTLRGDCVVHALEPDPANVRRLRGHIDSNRLNDVIIVHELGVSNRHSTANLNRHPGNSGHSAIVSDGEVKGVKLTTLDHFCESHGLKRVDMLILDVEGMEEQALLGAGKLLDRFQPLVCVEFFLPVMKRQGSSPDAAAAVLKSHGYNLFVARRNQLEPWSPVSDSDRRQNVFGFPRDSATISPRLSDSKGQRCR